MSVVTSILRRLGPPDVHPALRFNYQLRTPAFLSLIVIASSVFVERGVPALWWALMISVSLGWPLIAYAVAANRPSREAQREAERRNVYVDALLLGVGLGSMALQPWTVAAALSVIIPAGAIVGGVRMAAANLFITGGAAVAVAFLTGLGFESTSPVSTVVICTVAIASYSLALSLGQRTLTRTAIERGKQLKTQNDKIEAHSAELAEAQKAAQAAAEAAETANQTKSQFLANMSHELRTPLNAIIGYSEMLAEDAEDDGQDHLVPDLEKIRGAGKHLLGLINDVLDLSKVEAGKMDVHAEAFDPREMVGSVVATVQPLVQKNANTLVVETDALPAEMRSDLTKVRQILFNLLSNACKFTQDGTITLSGAVEGKALVFRVRDTGIGMTAEQVGKLFQPFVQADASTTRKYGGTGLGLTISRRFAELLGGGVAVESAPGEGTTFTVHLARDAKPEDADAEPAPKPGAETTRRPARVLDAEAPCVLVIDDDANSRDILVQTLQRSGLRTLEASDGEAGLALARERAPDLITLDVLMPGTDGWAVLRALKADPATARIPVVLVTINDDRATGYALGATDYVTKPFERDDLVQTIRQHLQDAETGIILVVEDDARTSELLGRHLEREGWTVRESATVEEALAVLDGAPPALLLLDLLLPDGTGFDVLDALNGHGVPVVVFTAKDLTDAERRRLKGHVERVFQKGRAAHTDVLAEIRRLLPVPDAVASGQPIEGT